MSDFFSWARFYAVLMKEFVQMKRDRLTFGMIVGVPILQLVLFGFAINTDPKGLPAALVAADESNFTRALVRGLENSQYFKFTHRVASEAEADLLMQRGEVQFALVIPPDFSHKLQRGEPAPVIVNLASQEYSRAALRPVLKARIVECVFEDWKDGQYKIISFFAKRARGLMARFAVQQRIESPEALTAFEADGYAFDERHSTADRLVFRRRMG